MQTKFTFHSTSSQLSFKSWLILIICLGLCHALDAAQHRLYSGITKIFHNPDGKAFNIKLDVRDLNLFSDCPREILVKVYDPTGKVLVRKYLEDDGYVSDSLVERIGGWDHELFYFMNFYDKGTRPPFRWSTWSDPKRLERLVKRSFSFDIPAGTKGNYRMVLAGDRDHVVNLDTSPKLESAYVGQHTWTHGRNNDLEEAYIYVPAQCDGLFLALVEHDAPRTRQVSLFAPDGSLLYKTPSPSSFQTGAGKEWNAMIKRFKSGELHGKVLKVSVSPGKNDFLLRLNFTYPRKTFNDYVGMGCSALYARSPQAAMLFKGGTHHHDGKIYFLPFQVRLHDWLKANPLNANDKQKAQRKLLEHVYEGFRYLEITDGRGSLSWQNWAYSMGYYGTKIWRQCWQIMNDPDFPASAKAIVREGMILGGDRISFATQIEKVNGNAFAQINVNLWYISRGLGDPMLNDRFELFFKRWSTEGWGKGAGLSKSGDAQEHFSHDTAYGSYIMDNWQGGHWKQAPILTDAKDDPRWSKVINRIRDLYTYFHCEDEKGRAVFANPWSSRTGHSAHKGKTNWMVDGRKAKNLPGPDFTHNVNGGSEWFAARRKHYYSLTFHGRLAPEWMCRSFGGQLGASGGTLCQLTIPGKGPVITSTLLDSYGKDMDPTQWRNFHLHATVGELWNGKPFISSFGEHENARLEGNTVKSSGEVLGARLAVEREFQYEADRIICRGKLKSSEYIASMTIWKPHVRKYSEVRLAYEMIPLLKDHKKKVFKAKINVFKEKFDPKGTATDKIRVDNGGYGVDILLDKERQVSLGENGTLLILLTDKEVKAESIQFEYQLVPFIN